MRLSIKKKSINEILISAFVGISVIFPADIYGLKKIFFLIICVLNLGLIFHSLMNRKNSFLAFFGFVFPTFLFLYSAVLTTDVFGAFTRSFAAYMLLIIFVIKNYNINYEKILIRSINIIMLMTLALVLLDLLNIINVNYGFFRNNIMYKYGLGLMGKSSTYPFYYKIFFKTSPLIVILLFKSFDKRKYLTTFLALTALVISGTRANVLFPVFFLCLFYIFYAKNYSKMIKFAFIFTGISLIIIFSSSLLEIFNEIFIVKGRASDVVRQGHIQGIIELVQNDPWIIIRGSGMGSVFYSYGRDSYVSSIEWSYIDLWRQMGFLFFFLFLVFITVPVFYPNKTSKKIAYISYLFISGTNPLLFSSTSYLYYIYMYYDLPRKTK